MDVYGCTRTKYDIPLNHLDYGYISSCSDKVELEKIIKILRSGDEGTYPELEKCAEERLISLDPENKILRKPETLKTPRDINKEEWHKISDDLQNWMQEVKVADQKLSCKVSDDDTLPPVRSAAAEIKVGKKSHTESTDSRSNKRVKPRDYREWDKFDIEAELEKVEAENKSKVKNVDVAKKTTLDEKVNTEGLTDEVKKMKAEREKNKGNEAFRAGDYEEALVYYNRSLGLCETVVARNNRAQTYLKLKKWTQALDDCEAVLKAEPSNLKAILRRAVANQGLTRYAQAKEDVEVVLAREPNNRQAMEVKKAVDKVLADQKMSGRRMVIEEVDGSDSENIENHLNETNNDSSKKVDEPVKGEKIESKSGAKSVKINEDTTEIQEPITGDEISAKPVTVELQTQSDSKWAAGDGRIDEPLPPAIQAMKDEGNDLFRKGQYGEALEKYGSAIQLLTALGRDAANLSTLYSNRAACLLKVGDCQGCIIDCDSALALCPGSTKALLRRAMAYETLEKYRQAYVDYRQVLNMDSSAEVAQQGSDRCANMLQRLDGSGWRDRLPKVPSSSNFFGLVPPSSQPEPIESTSTDNEKTFETYKTQGNAMFSKGDFQMAIDLFTKCIELFPDRAVPYTNRALCYLRLNKFDDVLSDCNQALSLEFHNVKALFRRAQAYKMLERYEESMIDLETLLKIDPTNKAAKMELQAVVKLKDDEREKRLQARLREHRQRVPIEEVDASSDEEVLGKMHAEAKLNVSRRKQQQQQQQQEEKVKSSKRTPQLNKVSAFEFIQAWSSLKGTNDVEPYVKILDQIQPSDLPKVITNKLDSDFLFTVIRCVDRLIARGDVQRGFEFLAILSVLPRFDTIVMFLSENEKKVVFQVFQQLAGTSVDTSKINALRKKYGL